MAKCTSPYIVKTKDKSGTAPVPCGKCPNCTARRISSWSFRLIQEDKKAMSAWFVTLTYSPENVPVTKNKFMTLKKKDVQDFLKRLRYYSKSKQKIKYYAAGEYGSETKRPHYHIILFNAEPPNVELAWGLGSIYFGTVSAQSVGYTLKYISKTAYKKMHSRDDRVPEFALMSKKLGANYLTEEMKKWHEADILNRMYCNIEGGKKISMPRYYKDQIYTTEQREHIGAHLAQKMEEKLKEEIAAYKGDYYHDKHENEKRALERQKFTVSKQGKI